MIEESAHFHYPAHLPSFAISKYARSSHAHRGSRQLWRVRHSPESLYLARPVCTQAEWRPCWSRIPRDLAPTAWCSLCVSRFRPRHLLNDSRSLLHNCRGQICRHLGRCAEIRSFACFIAFVVLAERQPDASLHFNKLTIANLDTHEQVLISYCFKSPLIETHGLKNVKVIILKNQDTLCSFLVLLLPFKYHRKHCAFHGLTFLCSFIYLVLTCVEFLRISECGILSLFLFHKLFVAFRCVLCGVGQSPVTFPSLLPIFHLFLSAGNVPTEI